MLTLIRQVHNPGFFTAFRPRLRPWRNSVQNDGVVFSHLDRRTAPTHPPPMRDFSPAARFLTKALL